MISFWILAAGLAALALLFVVPPLLRHQTAPAEIDQDDLNLQLFREQLAELDSDLAAGNLDQTQYDAARRDLERELLADVDGQTAHRAGGHQGGGRWMAIVLAIAVPAGAIGLYLQIGETEIIPRLQTAAKGPSGTGSVHAGTADELPPLDVLVERLAARMREQPEDLEGWMMLGRTYFAVDRPEEALAAFTRAYDLAPEDPEVMLAYAQGLAAANDGRLAGRPAELIAEALARHPENLNAQWLNGMLAYQRGQYRAALTAWEAVLPQLDPAGDEAAELRQFITAARRRAEEAGEGAVRAESAAVERPEIASSAQSAPAEAPTRGPATAAAPEGTVKVSVGLDESLWYQAAADDTLFVFARAASGPPMPLAVKRLQVKDLPTTVTLDDSLAMTPGLRLSSFSEVLVGARISKSGQATPQSGDLEGQAGPVSPGDGETVTLVIDQERP